MTLENFPTTRPAFTANFARSQQMPPQFTFSRATPGTNPSPGTVTGPNKISLSDYNTPRFAWKDGKCQGLLIEESRTNEMQHSQDFSNAYWGKVNVTLSADVTIAPDGTTTADSILEQNVANVQHGIYGPNLTGNTNVVQSIYVKPNGRENVSLRWYRRTDEWRVITFNLTGNGSVTQDLKSSNTFTSTGESITACGNGWYRISSAMSMLSTINTSSLILDHASTSTPTLDSQYGFENPYTPDTTKGYYIWGAQVEVAASFPTSYIPTSGATATRAQDILDITGTDFSSFWNSSAGTVVTSVEPIDTGHLWSIWSGQNRRIVFKNNGGTPRFENTFITNMTGTTYTGGVIGPSGDVVNVSIKNAVSFSTGYLEGANDGVLATVPSTKPDSMPTVTAWNFFKNRSGGSLSSGYLKRIDYYPTTVTTDALEALTQ